MAAAQVWYQLEGFPALPFHIRTNHIGHSLPPRTGYSSRTDTQMYHWPLLSRKTRITALLSYLLFERLSALNC